MFPYALCMHLNVVSSLLPRAMCGIAGQIHVHTNLLASWVAAVHPITSAGVRPVEVLSEENSSGLSAL